MEEFDFILFLVTDFILYSRKQNQRDHNANAN